VMCCSLWFLSRLVLEYFSTVPPFLPWKQDWVMCSFVIPFFTFGLKSIFQQSHPISTYESRDWVMCCSLWFPLCLVLRVFFNSPTQFLPMKADWVMLLFVIPFLCVYPKMFFQQSYQFLPMKAGIEWCAALLWFLLRLVLRFFNSPTQFLPMKAGIDVCLCDSFFVFGLKSIFQQSYPISTHESRDWVMCCSLWFLSLRLS
jgi:hypothetical protein